MTCSVLKKAIHGFLNIDNEKCDFPFSRIFSDATSPKMSTHPCAERGLFEIRLSPKAVKPQCALGRR